MWVILNYLCDCFGVDLFVRVSIFICICLQAFYFCYCNSESLLADDVNTGLDLVISINLRKRVR